ncbi:hypothetical protein HMSSN036_31630 [Paenibacillus macerans]|uniref:hypothetical protein n=1 Tax=Paenibacillus TaxID=44249 RepID=UPI00097B343E|nr:hypothetical protein [Paenibacillus macerans]MED4959718.1 hypothetical protein [Paenibacillus macerans]OMG50200.1 hypothetical protein BK140_06575 [Paenibacillus macerans]GJM70947.1 hypothetical protein HMSSN036_31630 [Paenibacillus macerans]
MQQIYPITEAGCRPYIGRPVCAVLRDGNCYVGTISAVGPEGIQFDGVVPGGASVLSKQSPKVRKQVSNLKSKAKTKAFGFGPFGPFGGFGGFGGFWLPWALLALLFLWPFFWI